MSGVLYTCPFFCLPVCLTVSVCLCISLSVCLSPSKIFTLRKMSLISIKTQGGGGEGIGTLFTPYPLKSPLPPLPLPLLPPLLLSPMALASIYRRAQCVLSAFTRASLPGNPRSMAANHGGKFG